MFATSLSGDQDVSLDLTVGRPSSVWRFAVFIRSRLASLVGSEQADQLGEQARAQPLNSSIIVPSAVLITPATT
jgi:hypothetical protein